MGFRDEVRRAKEAAAAQPEGLSGRERRERVKESLSAEDRSAFEQQLAPGFEPPFYAVLDTAGETTEPRSGDLTGWKPSIVEAYLGIVGIRSEDCFGIWPGRVSDSGGITSLVVAYRDRPEYAAGRERFARWRG